MSWLTQAKAANGKSVRTKHCSSDLSAVASAGDTGWSLYCFRCGKVVEFEPYPELSLQEKLTKLKAARNADEYHESSTALPEPANFDLSSWPTTHRAWLHRAGLFNSDIESLGIYYNPVTDRVVLPVVSDGKVCYWQARGFDKTRAKYLNPRVADPPCAKFGSGPYIVLVEDFLSAYRVGQHAEAWALLGTALKAGALAALLSDPRPVAVWLDPDAAGRTKGRQAALTLRTYGKAVRILASDADPKLLSSSQIKEVLCGS